MMNVILNSKLSDAAAPGAEQPYIKLNFGVKGHFFVLYCKNAETLTHIQKRPLRGTVWG